MKYRNPLANAHGMGSAKSGLRHWWMQRVTAVVLALLTPYAVYCLAKYGISDYAQLKALFANRLFSGVVLLYVLALFWHAQLGLAGGGRRLRAWPRPGNRPADSHQNHLFPSVGHSRHLLSSA